MPQVTLRYFAAARAAAKGCDEEKYEASSVLDALTAARLRHGEEFARVLSISTLLSDGHSVASAALDKPLGAAATVEVLPPFAGG